MAWLCLWNSFQPESTFLPNFTRKQTQHLIPVESSCSIDTINICISFSVIYYWFRGKQHHSIGHHKTTISLFTSAYFSLTIWLVLHYAVSCTLCILVDFCQFNAIYNLLGIIGCWQSLTLPWTFWYYLSIDKRCLYIKSEVTCFVPIEKRSYMRYWASLWV